MTQLLSSFMSRSRLMPLLVAALCLSTLGDRSAATPTIHWRFAAIMPRIVVWAWEEPEDLRSAPVRSVGVAYLAETILLRGGNAQVARRHQPLWVAPGAAVMAVVRIIALPGFRDSRDLRRQTAEALAQIAYRAPARGLQIDFDATASQRAFYADVLRQLRPRMTAGMPLSITALLSWCAARPGNDDWLGSLPIDEAVPMFFRLGASSRPAGDKSGFTIREPLCRGSLGISTDESWPPLDARARIYVFAPRPWTSGQLAALEDVAQGKRTSPLQQDADAARLQPKDTGLFKEKMP